VIVERRKLEDSLFTNSIDAPIQTTEPQTEQASELRTTLSLFFEDGEPIIVSRLFTNSNSMAKDAFASIDEAAQFAEAQDRDPDVSNIYVNLQKLKPGSTTDKRADVEQYVRFLVDIDRKSKMINGIRVNASDAERDQLRKAADDVKKWVSNILGAHPLIADSGNGFHLCWNLRPNAFTSLTEPNEENQNTYKECLLAIKQRFDTESVEIDTSLSEPEQIIRLWGTHNRHDPETPGRPHRRSQILAKARGTVSLAALGLLACEYKAPASSGPAAKGDVPALHEDFDESSWWEHYSDIFVCEQERDSWQVTSICPATYEGPECPGHRHTGSTLTGFRFDRGRAEFHCFSDDHCEMTFGQLVRHLSQHHPPFPGKIWDWENDDFSDFAEAVDAIPEIEASFANNPNGRDESYNLKGTPCPTCNQALVSGALDSECKSCLRKTMIKQTQVEGEIELASGAKEGGCVALNIMEAHSIITEELRWLWPFRVPAFKVTLFAGKGGCGKSTVVIDIISRVTRGRDWPDGTKNVWGAKMVLMAFTEDDASDTVVPKLVAAGADLSLIKIISKVSGIMEGKAYRRPFNLKDDMKLLEKALKENPDIALIALDPIASYYGDRDSNADKDMRPIFEGLQQLCARTETAVLGIIHHNKKSDLDALQRISGAGSMGNVTRAVWSFSRDPENKQEYFMSSAKNNNAPADLGGLKYSMVNVGVRLSSGQEDLKPRIEWLGATDMDANEVDQKTKDVQRVGGADTKIAKMKLWVKAELQAGAKLATDMYRAAEREFGEGTGKTLKRAQVEIGGLTTKAKPYYWYLPGFEPTEVTSAIAEDPQIPETAVL
jgi:putative DNA primase/helicase